MMKFMNCQPDKPCLCRSRCLIAIPMSKMIKNNKLLIFDSCMGHVGSNELFKVKDDLEEFIKEFRDI